MIFALLVAALGVVILLRVFDFLTERHLFERGELTKIGTAYFFAAILLVCALPFGHLTFWCAIFAPLFVVAVALRALVERRSRAFRAAIRETLSIISLKMKGGRSFRQAFSEASAESEPWVRAKLSEIGSAVVFSQQNASLSRDLFVSAVVEELSIIDRQPHASLKRLAVYRDKLRIEEDFRRKSGQVLARIRAQSLVMSFLYAAIAAYVAWKFGVRGNEKFFAGSLACFVAGALWIWFGGRRIQWTV